MLQDMHQHAAFIVGVLGVSLTLGCAGEPGTAEALGESADASSTAPGEPNHEEITSTALAFLKPAVISALKIGNVSTDAEFYFSNAAHFDDCNFSGGAAFIAEKQAEAVAALGPGIAQLDGDALALLAFSRSLHAVQDFYAHTNWVELGGDVLVDQSLTAFPALARDRASAVNADELRGGASGERFGDNALSHHSTTMEEILSFMAPRVGASEVYCTEVPVYPAS
ncbi:hypothetical protein WME73_11980 [Sorangium sp. So ce302]|uniref:hypothetical protein n=1 Tax=Sorangium sp. So ce302 TaxID=3133297 RepID=UPI003F62314A